jgi:hypothetical protein
MLTAPNFFGRVCLTDWNDRTLVTDRVQLVGDFAHVALEEKE